MKALIIAAATLALLTVPAHAQVNSKRHAGDAQTKADPGRPKVDEKAYKAALATSKPASPSSCAIALASFAGLGSGTTAR